ncbi:MAG: (2Fe-2S)-binding protein [Candidatus Marinimicrobia bacterium]|nr:(2Fe-2S)-binding protein [Candidatus Neomarinimicrobiota bacterium]
MSQFTLTVNGKAHSVNVDPETPLLWILRDTLGLTGTKFGCGRGLCGACTILLDGEATRSCMTPVEYAVEMEITTIEGLSVDSKHSLQLAWIEEEVPQCGYCQSGQIMTAAALMKEKSHPTDEDINVAMRMNLCRCGTYQRIRRAIHKAAQVM